MTYGEIVFIGLIGKVFLAMGDFLLIVSMEYDLQNLLPPLDRWKSLLIT